VSSKRLATLTVAFLLVGAVVPATAVAKNDAAQPASVIYSSLVSSPLHGNLPSVGGEAYAFNEFGNAVTFSASKNRSLTNVTVTMSSWGCQSGSWYAHDCVSKPGATFSLPITFNVYQADGTTLIKSVTQVFSIPYRPSASASCTDGRWWDTATKACFNGLATNITFNLGRVQVPDSIVFGIAYNTTHYGYHPVGEAAACYTSSGGCGYDSLNIALTQDPTDVSAGSDTTPGTIWQNSPYGGLYCDGGAAGSGSFRLDSPTGASCWGVDAPYNAAPYYVPAVEIKAAN
jgi:hypothetical protein